MRVKKSEESIPLKSARSSSRLALLDAYLDSSSPSVLQYALNSSKLTPNSSMQATKS